VPTTAFNFDKKRTHLKHLKPLPPLFTKFKDLPPIKYENVLPSMVINALDGTFDLTSPIIKEILDRVGNKASDYPMAVRVAKLMGQYPAAPLTELITYDWLRGSGIGFVYQAQLYGGRASLGGVLPDFLVEDGGQWNVFQIQGTFWHSYKVNQGQDAGEKLKMIGQTYGGRRIGRVTGVWEQRIYRNRPDVFLQALAGYEWH
jgi:hypothetical protein